VRRRKELGAEGDDAALEVIEREIRERDLADSTRADSPLTRVADAVYLDTTELTPGEVLERMSAVVERGRHEPGAGSGG
jgi:cytidylate kinase